MEKLFLRRGLMKIYVDFSFGKGLWWNTSVSVSIYLSTVILEWNNFQQSFQITRKFCENNEWPCVQAYVALLKKFKFIWVGLEWNYYFPRTEIFFRKCFIEKFHSRKKLWRTKLWPEVPSNLNNSFIDLFAHSTGNAFEMLFGEWSGLLERKKRDEWKKGQE